jgi:hypothetical protein
MFAKKILLSLHLTGYNFVPSNFTDTNDAQLRSTAIYPTSYNLWALENL